jgi:hypothetical protein
MTISGEYAPGPCNIGDDEIRRRLAGWVGAAGTIIILVGLVAADAPPVWYLAIFLPAIAGAAGFVQAASRFCFYFGFSGIFNFRRAGRQELTAEPEALRLDRAAARRLLAISCAIAGIVTLIAFGGALAFR